MYQNERDHVEQGTVDDGEQWEPGAKENWRKHQRMEDPRKGTETTDRDVLESMDWTEGQATWRSLNLGRRDPGKGQRSTGRTDGIDRDRCGARTERTGKSICNSILSTRDVDDVTGKLRDMGEVALLPDRPKRRGAEQGVRALWSVKRVNSRPSKRKQK